MTEFELNLLALLGEIARSLGELARHTAPEAPNYKRPISQFAGFDWSSIGATVVKADQYGPSQVEWQDQVYTRRSPENKFGDAIWFSRADGKDADGNNRYVRLITFKALEDAEPISRKAEALVKTPPPPADTIPAQVAPAAPAARNAPQASDTASSAEQAFADLPGASAGRPPMVQPPAAIGPKINGGAKPNSAQAIMTGGVNSALKDWAKDFAERYPRYRLQTRGSEDPDLYHILKTIGNLGIPQVSPANLAEVQQRLEHYASTN